MNSTSIAIVGAGFSGTLLALHLLRRCPPSTHVCLIERNGQFGRGPAYSTGNPSHLLNVPAARMSAFHDKPSDFVDWIRTQRNLPACVDADHPGFVPRQLFGAYVRHHLNQELKRPRSQNRLDLIHGDVAAIIQQGDRLELQIGRSRAIQADIVVLATGNFPPEAPPVADPSFYDSALYRPDPWASDAFTRIDPADQVLLIGTGLTMVDAVISLLDQGHSGPIHAISRRGLLPQRHGGGVASPSPQAKPFPTSVTALTRFIRDETARAVAEGSTWHAIIDQLRPFTQDVWSAMAPDDRARFLRHLRPWWDIHRHRLAPAVATRIDGAIASGQLKIEAGRIRAFHPQADHVGRVSVDYRTRHAQILKSVAVSRVINCSGPACDYDRISHPLIRNLLAEGLVNPDPLRLGLDVTANCALKDGRGSISRQLFAVGPSTKSAFWEITAIPDIRRQCEFLAEYLATLVKQGVQTGAQNAKTTIAPDVRAEVRALMG